MLVADVPCQTHCREKSETIAFCEGFGTGVTEVSFYEIASVISISHTAYQPLFSIGQGIVVVLCFFLHIQEHSAYVMFFGKSTVVVDSRFEINSFA